MQNDCVLVDRTNFLAEYGSGLLTHRYMHVVSSPSFHANEHCYNILFVILRGTSILL